MTKADVLVVMAEMADELSAEAARAREFGSPSLEGQLVARAETWRIARSWVERIDSLEDPEPDDEAAA